MDNQNNTLPSANRADADKEDILRVALAEWIARNKPLTEIFLDAYCIVDLSNRVVDFNVAFSELCGETYRKILKIGNFCELFKSELCPHQCPAIQMLTSEKSIRIDELKASSKAFPDLRVILGGIPIRSENDEILGSMITIRNVSAESELQKKYDLRKIESVTDGLTRLYNKSFAEAALLRAVKNGLREVHCFSILLLDIDHFKRVNDTYGHQCGDYVLSTIAQMLKGEIRDTDTVGRFGGEEFIVLLANSDVQGSKIFAERFRQRVASTKILFEGKHIPITCSLGTTTFKELWKPGVNTLRLVKEVLNRADTALYFAKANGRNQTRQFEELPEHTTVLSTVKMLAK